VLFRSIRRDLKFLIIHASNKRRSNSEESVSSIQPARVTNSINIPIRQQIAWAKAYKRLLTSQSTAGTTRKFRQTKGPKEKEEEYTEINYHETKPPAIFVDGYNIIGYINSVEGRSISFEDARDCLISDLGVLRGATGWCIEVVFDAYKSGLGGSSTSINNIQVTYTSASETADNHIERRFEELRREGFSNMVVATDDTTLRMVAGSAGAGFISASMIVEEFRIAYHGWEVMQEDAREQERMRRPSIGDSITPEMKTAIAENKKKQREERQVLAEKLVQAKPPKPQAALTPQRTLGRPTIGSSLSVEAKRAIELLSLEQKQTQKQRRDAPSQPLISSSSGIPEEHRINQVGDNNVLSRQSLSMGDDMNTLGHELLSDHDRDVSYSSETAHRPKTEKQSKSRKERRPQEVGESKKFSVGDGLSDEVRRAIELMKMQNEQ